MPKSRKTPSRLLKNGLTLPTLKITVINRVEEVHRLLCNPPTSYIT